MVDRHTKPLRRSEPGWPTPGSPWVTESRLELLHPRGRSATAKRRCSGSLACSYSFATAACDSYTHSPLRLPKAERMF
jgi:hypothetical protein